jgi:hypothetical protein
MMSELEFVRCANCGKPILKGEPLFTHDLEEGEACCSKFCNQEHIERGCPLEVEGRYRDVEWYASLARSKERAPSREELDAMFIRAEERQRTEEWLCRRLSDWLDERDLRDAGTAFTAGDMRNLARKIEDELRKARMAPEVGKGTFANGETFDELLVRANMDMFAFNSGVVRGTDNTGRIQVTSAMEHTWGDCIGVGYMIEGQRGWYFTHLSPARARVLAHFLLAAAMRREASDPGMKCIDRDWKEKK